MKSWVTVTLIFSVIIAVLSYYVTLYFIPRYEMSKVEDRIALVAGGKNLFRHAPRPTSAFRSVVRPSPDQIYSACVYDLSKGPVHFFGPIPDSYWSLSMFAHNSDNFFVVNDSQLDKKNFDYILIEKGQATPEGVPAKQVITSPSASGIALIRVFIDRDERLDELDRIRRMSYCNSFTGEK